LKFCEFSWNPFQLIDVYSASFFIVPDLDSCSIKNIDNIYCIIKKV